MDHGKEEDGGGSFTHGYWFVAYLDLLGIRRELLKTDFLPGDDPKKKEELIAALKASVGAIRYTRKWLAGYFEGLANADPDGLIFDGLPPEKVAEAMRLRRTRVRRDGISDGTIVACPLTPRDGHFPIRGVYEGISACASLMLLQLAAEKPIRGGLDVATGVEIDDELFGAAYVKAYELESKCAQYPRLVVGEGLVNYLQASLRAPGTDTERQVERKMAEGCLGYLKKDSDDVWIVDYAGPHAHHLLLNKNPGAELLVGARCFAHQARGEFQRGTDEESRKLFGRYSQLVRYLDACGP
jgi:hypothetical protein